MGSVATTGELGRAGISARMVAQAVGRGDLVRVRRGWYAVADTPVVRALRAGGAAGCITGAALHGCWAAADTRLHVAVLNHARTINDPDSGRPLHSAGDRLVVHWTAAVPLEISRGLLPLADCLDQVIACQDADIAFAILESALARGLLGKRERAELWRIVPRSKQSLLLAARSDAGSGNESIFRFRMLGVGVEMQSQVWVPGVGIVDFLIGDRLLVEIDSESHHGGREARLRDIARDAAAASLGAITLRFDQSQILGDWQAVENTVLAVMERGDHLSRR